MAKTLLVKCKELRLHKTLPRCEQCQVSEARELNEEGLISRLRSEVMDPEVCQSFTIDDVKAALRNIIQAKEEGTDKIHTRFQHHLGRSPYPF